MRLLSLEVTNYRNIASASLTPGRELTVICGNNGQGKTNLLEAIWLLTGGKSFRGGKDAELVRRGEPFAVLEASTLRAQQEEQEPDEPNRVRLTVGTPDSQRPGRYASVNGAAPRRAAGLAGSFPAVVFDPGHLSLVKGAPEGRRKFLDAALCQLYPGYLTVYRRYLRALQQKNALLRRSPAGQDHRPEGEGRRQGKSRTGSGYPRSDEDGKLDHQRRGGYDQADSRTGRRQRRNRCHPGGSGRIAPFRKYHPTGPEKSTGPVFLFANK